MKLWDSRFMDSDFAKSFGDRRFNYVPFHELSRQDQEKARRMYVYKGVGAKYPFIDEHYYYPVTIEGVLANARRTLAIPYRLIKDERYMASLGYEVNPDWHGGSMARDLVGMARDLVAGPKDVVKTRNLTLKIVDFTDDNPEDEPAYDVNVYVDGKPVEGGKGTFSTKNDAPHIALKKAEAFMDKLITDLIRQTGGTLRG